MKTSRIGEIHKSVTFLSPQTGILSAIAHGAYKGKSKLGGVTEVFSHSRLYLYHNPVKNSYKISDVEPISVYTALRQDLAKYYVGSLWSEVIIRTYAGGGDYHSIFRLLREALSLLDTCEERRTDAVLALFLYRYVESLGYLPDFGSCANCGGRLDDEHMWYIGAEGAVRCHRCADPDLPSLSPGARRYLMYGTSRPLQELLKVDLDISSRTELKRAMISIIQHVIGGPLNTLRGAGGII